MKCTVCKNWGHTGKVCPNEDEVKKESQRVECIGISVGSTVIRTQFAHNSVYGKSKRVASKRWNIY
jgi:hypothetical protein